MGLTRGFMHLPIMWSNRWIWWFGVRGSLRSGATQVGRNAVMSIRIWHVVGECIWWDGECKPVNWGWLRMVSLVALCLRDQSG